MTEKYTPVQAHEVDPEIVGLGNIRSDMLGFDVDPNSYVPDSVVRYRSAEAIVSLQKLVKEWETDWQWTPKARDQLRQVIERWVSWSTEPEPAAVAEMGDMMREAAEAQANGFPYYANIPPVRMIRSIDWTKVAKEVEHLYLGAEENYEQKIVAAVDFVHGILDNPSVIRDMIHRNPELMGRLARSLAPGPVRYQIGTEIHTVEQMEGLPALAVVASTDRLPFFILAQCCDNGEDRFFYPGNESGVSARDLMKKAKSWKVVALS